MATIQEQITQQRTQVAQAQQKSQEALRQLQQAEAKIPEYQTQKALRQTYTGITGQQKRGVFQRIKSAILGQKQQVQQYQQGLQQYEQQVLTPAEQQVREAQARAEQYNYAVRAYLGQVSGGSIKDVPLDIRRAAQQQAESLERQSSFALTNYVRKFEQNNPGEKLIVDWDNFQIKGVESGALGASIPVSEYNKIVQSFQSPQMSIQDIPAQTLNVQMSSSLESPQLQSRIPMSWATPEPTPQIKPSVLQQISARTGYALTNLGKVVSVVGQVPVPNIFNVENLRPSIYRKKDYSTLGREVGEFRRATGEVGKASGEAVTYGFTKAGVPLTIRTSPIDLTKLQDRKIEKIPSAAGVLVKVAEASPELLLSTTSVGLGTLVGGEALASAETLSPKEVERLKREQIENIYTQTGEMSYSEGFRRPTIQEIESELGPQIEQDITSSAKLGLGLAVGTGLLFGGLKGGRELFKERILSREGGQIAGPETGQLLKGSPFGQEVSSLRFQVPTEEGVRLVEYPRGISMKEPVIEKYTTKFRDILKFPAKERIVVPPKIYVDAAVFPYVDDSMTIFFRQSVKKSGELGIPKLIAMKGGKSVRLTAEQISKIKVPEYLRSELAKMKFKDIAKFSPDLKEPLSFKTEEVFGVNELGTIEVSKRVRPPFKVGIDTKKLIVDVSPNLGKFEKFSVLAKTTPLKKIGPISFFKIDQVTKRGTKRAIGKVSRAKGFVVELPPQRLTEEDLQLMNPFYKGTQEGKGIVIVKSTGGKKTPLSKTFQQQVVTKPILIPSPPKTPRPKVALEIPEVKTVDIKTATLTPTIVEPKTSSSLYYGTGQYERTEGGQLPGEIDLLGFEISQPTRARIDTSLSPISFVISELKKKEITRTVPKVLQRSYEVLKSLVPQKEVLILKQPQIVRIAQKQVQVSREVLRTPQVPRPRVPRTPFRPRPRVVLVPNLEETKKKRTFISTRKSQEQFLAITKRYGKEKVVGIGKTAKEAELIARKDVLGSLGATVKVKTTRGRQIPLQPDEVFRLSKRDPLAIVQKSPVRLASLGERREIQRARKKEVFSLR